MKPTNFRILTPIILVLFILSLFTGMTAAQTAAGEQYEKTVKQYQINKEKFENTKKQFQDAKNLFEDANRRFKDIKNNKSDNISNEELIEKAREYIIKAINHTEAQLQVMKNRLDNPENKGILASDATKIIDTHIVQLGQLREKVSQATTIQEIRDTHKELKNIVVKINLETRYFMGIVLNRKIDIFIARADNVSAKADAAIEKLDADGKDTSKLKEELEDFNNKMKEAKDMQAKTTALFATHSGFASDGTVTDEKQARDFLKEANELQRETIKKLKEAGMQLKGFGKDYRKIAGKNVKVNEKDDLEVNGEATTTLTVQ